MRGRNYFEWKVGVGHHYSNYKLQRFFMCNEFQMYAIVDYHEGISVSLLFPNYQDIFHCVYNTLISNTILFFNLACKIVLPSIPLEIPTHSVVIHYNDVLATTLRPIYKSSIHATTNNHSSNVMCHRSSLNSYLPY